MATDGGVLIYGIDEDDDGRVTILCPIALDGAEERVTAIIRTGVAAPPEVVISPIRTAADPSVGYLVVAVPPSPQAPHMVILGHDNRYYGRRGKQNVPLTEGEVARLYERRRRWQQDVDQLLTEVVKAAPIPATPGHAFLHLGCSPVGTPPDLLTPGRTAGPAPTFLGELVGEAAQQSVFPQADIPPPFLYANRWRKPPRGWVAYLHIAPQPGQQRDPGGILDMQVNKDGSARLLCGRAGIPVHGEEQVYVIEEKIAELTTRFSWMMGQLYRRIGFLGPVDLGVAITGVQGSRSARS